MIAALGSATALAAAVRERRVTAREVTAAHLDRIATRDPDVGAFVVVDAEGAVRRAERVDAAMARGEPPGVLSGVPVGLKDCCFVGGLPNTCGTMMPDYWVADEDCLVARRLGAAGAVNVGKLRMTELAMGTFGTNPIQGTPTNPRAPDRIPGGSSSGSAAAVAAGLVPIAIGTDTGGSIRIPAACCGVVGLKPTYGLIGTAGIMPLAPTLDHVGVIAGSVRDAALALLGVADLAPADRLRGALERLVAAPGPRVFVVGVPEGDDFDDVHPDVAAALATSASRLEHAGATISRIRLPHVTTLIDATAVIVRVEASAAHAYRIDRGDTMAPFVRARLSAGLDVRAVDYLSARRELDAARTAFVREVFGIVDALLLPMTPEPALRLGETEGDPDTVGRRMARFARFARFFNGLGIPAISVPAGASREGVPLAVQVAAAPFQDDTVLAAAAALTRERECT